MNPLAIKARNYRTFEELDLQLPAGVAAITGPNGAGKSSLVNLVDLCLFGAEGRSWAPYLTQGAESTEMMIELVFEHRGETYLVRRGYSARGRGKTTLDLEILTTISARDPEGQWDDAGEGWRPLTRETIEATQGALEELLGLTRETFRASAFLTQGDGAAFTEAQPRDRKRILQAVLGLDRFDVLLGLVKRDRKAAEVKVERLSGSLERADAGLQEKPALEARLEAARSSIAKSRARHDEATAAHLKAETAVSEAELRARTRAEALATLAQATGRLQPLEHRVTAAVEAETALRALQDELDALTTEAQMARLRKREAELNLELEGYRSKLSARQAATRDREMAEAKRNAIIAQTVDLVRKRDAARLKAEEYDGTPTGSTCDRCGQTLGEEARQSTIASLRAEADELDAARRDLEVQAEGIALPEIPPEPEPPADEQAELAEVVERLTKARQDELQRQTLTERARTLDAVIGNRPSTGAIIVARTEAEEARESLAEIPEVEPGDLASAQSEASRLARAVVDHREMLQRAEREEAAMDADLRRLVALEIETIDERRDREALRKDLDRLAILERAYGRDGIPALIIASAAIPSIEAEADRILAELGTSYRVELRTEKALASGATADALDVVVQTDTGERPYETFSGGERTRLNLALRIALARLLAHRRGAESRLLAIDEPEFLDEAGTAALAGVLQGLAGDFERVYLISHVPDLRDAFDASLEVVKGDDGRSRVAV